MSWGKKMFLIVVIGFCSRSILQSLIGLGYGEIIGRFYIMTAFLQFIIPASIYEAIKWIIKPEKSGRKLWLHVLAPTLVLISLVIPVFQGVLVPQHYATFDELINQLPSFIPVFYIHVLWVILFYFYAIFSIKLIFDSFWKLIQHPVYKKLVIFASILVSLFLLMLIAFSLELVYTGITESAIVQSEKLMLFKPIIFSAVIAIEIMNPKLFGIDRLTDESTSELQFWKLPAEKNLNRDERLKILSTIKNIEKEIEDKKLFRNIDFTIEDLSSYVNYSTGRIRSIFKDYCELSFVEYRNYKRVQDFKEQILSSDNSHLSLEGIGELVGFGSKSACLRSVKKFENATPKELLNRLKLGN